MLKIETKPNGERVVLLTVPEEIVKDLINEAEVNNLVYLAAFPIIFYDNYNKEIYAEFFYAGPEDEGKAVTVAKEELGERDGISFSVSEIE